MGSGDEDDPIVLGNSDSNSGVSDYYSDSDVEYVGPLTDYANPSVMKRAIESVSPPDEGGPAEPTGGPAAKKARRKFKVNFKRYQYRNGSAIEEDSVDVGTQDAIVSKLKGELATLFETKRQNWQKGREPQLWRYIGPAPEGVHFTILADETNTKFKDVATAVVFLEYDESNRNITFNFDF